MKEGTAGEKFLPNSRRRQRKKLTSNYRRQERERESATGSSQITQNSPESQKWERPGTFGDAGWSKKTFRDTVICILI